LYHSCAQLSNGLIKKIHILNAYHKGRSKDVVSPVHKQWTNLWHVDMWNLHGTNWTCQLVAWERNDSVGRLDEPKTVLVIGRKLFVLKTVINFILNYLPFLYILS